MCMNCGCGTPNEDHGKPANITASDLQRAGDVNRQSLRESAQHILETVSLIDAPRRDDPAEGPVGSAGRPGTPAERGTSAERGTQAERGTPATES